MTMQQRVEDKDGNWLRQSFMIPRGRVKLADQRAQMFQDVDIKFTDASLGGNLYINPTPQWSRYTDLRRRGRNKGNSSTNTTYDGSGMGRYYSEAMDENAQVVYMRFGVPEYNSLTTFFTGFYDVETSLLARTGRGPSLFYTAGRITGFVLSLPLAPLIGAGAVYRWIAQNPASKFYYFKPTQPLYWNCVNNMANIVVANSGIYPRLNLFGNEAHKTAVVSGAEAQTDAVFDSSLNARLHQLAPDIYWEGGGIDIYAVANRATRMAHRERERQIAAFEKHTDSASLSQMVKSFFNEGAESTPKQNGNRGDLDNLLNKWVASAAGTKDGPPTENQAGLEETTGGGYVVEGTVKKGWWDAVWSADGHLQAELADGSAFIGLRVNPTGTVDESFSAQTRQSDLMSTINSQSSTARNLRFNFGNGNISDGVLGNAVEGMVGSVKDFVAGNLDSIGASGLGALYGSAFADIPEHFDQAIFNAPSVSYTMELRTPYGNKLSVFNSVMLPIIMMLAGALPRSTGKHSYTSPFLCQIYSKGRQQIRLGIIDSLTISRGVGNLGWTQDGRFIGADVRFSVKDLSSIMHMPMANDSFPNPLKGSFDEDTVFNDYMATLGSLGLMDQVYISRRLELALTKSMVKFRSWTSPARFANWANGTLPGRVANTVARELDRNQ